MTAFSFILSFFFFAPAHGLEYSEMQRGAVIQLSRAVVVNHLLSEAGMICRIGMRAVYPKVSVGPMGGEGVLRAKYFMVVDRATDPTGYRIYLQSEQLPCPCTLWLDQSRTVLGGLGSDFAMFTKADPREASREPSDPLSCGHLPDWFNFTSPSDDDDTIEL